MWEKEYYDLGHTAAHLKKEEKPYLLTHGEMFKPEFLMPNGMIDYDNFAKMAVTFYKYFVTPDLFDKSEVPGLKIPRRKSMEYTTEGHSVVRRFSGRHIINEIEQIGFLDKHDIIAVARTCGHAKLMPPSIAYELTDAYGIKLDFQHFSFLDYILEIKAIKEGIAQMEDSKDLEDTDDSVLDLIADMDIGVLQTTIEPEDRKKLGEFFWVRFQGEEKNFFDCLDAIRPDSFWRKRKMGKQNPKLYEYEAAAATEADYAKKTIPHPALESSLEDIRSSSFILTNFPEKCREKISDHYTMKYLNSALEQAVRRDELSKAAELKGRIKEILKK